MGKLIAIVGVSGVGKTSLVKALSAAGDFATGLEEHNDRPFQLLFDQDKGYALHNQVDYFLLRARQEKTLRAEPKPGLIDGGLDVDFHGFTRLFQSRGYLNDAELDLLARLYAQLRTALPMPELVIYLTASDDVIRERLAGRDRVNIATAPDAGLLKKYLEEWLDTLPQDRVLYLDVSESELSYINELPVLLGYINGLMQTENDR